MLQWIDRLDFADSDVCCECLGFGLFISRAPPPVLLLAS